MVTFRCGHCAQRLTAIDEKSGTVLTCPSCDEPVRIPSAFTPEQTEPLALIARPAVEFLPGSDPWLAELAQRLRSRLVDGLLTQRRQLIQTQDTGTIQLTEFEQRIAQLQKLHRERIQELKLRLDARESEIRRLRRQKAALLVELESRSSPETRLTAELRDAGLLLRA